MKRLAILGLIGLFACVAMAGSLNRLVNYGHPALVSRGSGLMCKAEPWHLIRAISADDTAFSATNSGWSNGQYFYHIDERATNVSIMFLAYGDGAGAGDPSSGTFSWELSVVKQYGPIETVADGTQAIGALQASHLPHNGTAVDTASNYCFGELPVVSNDYWATSCVASGTTDKLGAINFDPLNSWGLDLRITSLTNITTLYMYATFREP